MIDMPDFDGWHGDVASFMEWSQTKQLEEQYVQNCQDEESFQDYSCEDGN